MDENFTITYSLLIAMRASANEGVTLHDLSVYIDNSNMKLISILQM